MSDKTSGPQGRYAAGTGGAMSLAFEFAGAVFMFVLLGIGLERVWDIEPWGRATGGVVGWIGGTLHVYYATYGKQNAEKDTRS